jgi:predicted outer membrane repeat protein
MEVEVCHTAVVTAAVNGGETKALDWYVNHLLGGDSEHGTVTQTNPATYTAPDIIPSAETLMIIAVSREDDTKADTCRFDVVFNVRHVNGTTGDDDTGTGTLLAPLGSIGKGLELVGAGMTVEVAAGTYYEHDLEMTRGATLRSETGRADCVTIDAQQHGLVLRINYADTTTRVEGFTITGGLTDETSPASSGGGINCIYDAYPTISNCLFIRNSARYGAGLNTWNNSSPTVVNCTFAYNHAASSGGGTCCWLDCSPRFTNCTFFGNSAGSSGGGLYCRLGSVPVLENCIIAFGGAGGAVDSLWNDGLPPTLTCCDIFGNEGGDWTEIIANQLGLSGNFEADPLFCDTLSLDLRLEACSPCLPGYHPDGADCGTIGAWGEGCACSR